MELQPAHINQVIQTENGQYVEVSGDVCGVVADLKKIDPKLGVRFAISAPEPFFAVFYRPDENTTELVLTQRAYQGATGMWLGLDQRVVKRVMEIGSSTYDFAKEVEKQNRDAERRKEKRSEERIEQATDKALYEFRKLTGSKSRAFIKK